MIRTYTLKIREVNKVYHNHIHTKMVYKNECLTLNEAKLEIIENLFKTGFEKIGKLRELSFSLELNHNK